MPALSELKKLLDKIGTTKCVLKLEVNYDGREFNWKFYQANMTASEWAPRSDDLKKEHVDITRRT